jgi:hypothetical protein
MTSHMRRTYLVAQERDDDIHRPVANCSEAAYMGLHNRRLQERFLSHLPVLITEMKRPPSSFARSRSSVISGHLPPMAAKTGVV